MSRTLQLLLLLLLGGLVRADASVRPYKNVTDGPHSCGGVDIPYPFGIMDEDGNGDFHPGFDVICTDGEPGLATSGGDGKPIPISNFSVERAEARVKLPVAWQWYNSNGLVGDYDLGNIQFKSEGVYRISNAKNYLFVLGCGTVGYLRSQKDPPSGTYAQYTGCLCYCNNSNSAVNGYCSGVGCCHADVPPNLLDNSVDFFGQIRKDGPNFSSFDYAFLAEKDHYKFKTSDLKRNLRRTAWSMPVMLDWAIRDNLTCKDARKKGEYACKSSNSLCLKATNGPGYICKCRKGYEGNPYILDGCTDFNECEDHDHHPCEGVCRNLQGSYECTCPKNTHSSDPSKQPCEPNVQLSTKITIGATLGAIVIVFIMVTILFLWILAKEKRKMREHFEKNGGPTLAKLNNIRLFTKDDLRKIRKTNNVIGSGGFGKVYKGCIEDSNEQVAVKEPIDGNSADKDQFVNEISIQSRVIHKNIVKLIGCCLEVDVPILVYEFVPNGSLHDILHGGGRIPLDIGLRLQIAAESAEGLAYMHSKTTTNILHGDVKPANILLNDQFIPKISDFGISRLIATDMQHTGHVIGDMSYVDPVFLQTGLLTNKSDVYSFGVVLLELITRKKASHSDNNSVVKNFLEAYTKDKSVIELVDKELGLVDREIIDNFARLIMQCINLDVNQRPEMIEVAELLRDMVKRYLTK